MKKLKKTAICLMMSLAVLAASSVATGITAQAASPTETEVTAREASPYWGAAYLSAGARNVTIYVENVQGTISGATLKSWDFSSSSYGTMSVDIQDPSGNSHDIPILLKFNHEKSGPLATASNQSGTYTVEISVLDGSHSGGWVGCWLY